MHDAHYIQRLATIAAKSAGLNPNSIGGCLCFFKTLKTGEIIGSPEITLVGTASMETQMHHIRNAVGVATGIIEHNLNFSSEKQTSQNNNHCAGIRYKSLVVAFEGFTRPVNEAMSLIYGVCRANSGLTSQELKDEMRFEIGSHTQYQNNKFIQPIFEKLFT